MGEKLYKPIIKNGDHLVRSKKHKNRVRGVSQNSENKATDIIEWEEVDIDSKAYELTQSTCEQDEEDIIANFLATAIIIGATALTKKVIEPWWENSAKPWVKQKINNIKANMSSKYEKQYIANTVTNTDAMLSEMFDQKFNDIKFNMSTDEAQFHYLNLINHILEVAYEIKILSNTKISDQSESEQTKIENQAQAEKLLSGKVTDYINKLLSDDALKFGDYEQRQLNNLLGGGIKVNDKYIPVELNKVNDAMNSIGKKNQST